MYHDPMWMTVFHSYPMMIEHGVHFAQAGFPIAQLKRFCSLLRWYDNLQSIIDLSEIVGKVTIKKPIFDFSPPQPPPPQPKVGKIQAMALHTFCIGRIQQQKVLVPTMLCLGHCPWLHACMSSLHCLSLTGGLMPVFSRTILQGVKYHIFVLLLSS